MALEVEDGSGKQNSESFASVAEADAYWSNRGVASWAADTPAKEVALRKATDYLEQKYRLLWCGQRATYAQALSWPRVGVVVDGFSVPSNLVPVEVRRATIELAKRAAVGELMPDAVNSSGEVIHERIGDMEVSYAAGTNTGTSETVYASATKWLSAFLANGNMAIRSTQVLRS